MTVYFANSGAIDLDTIRTMGVSVKTGDSPIGYFGTGLKYAIATLLRTKHEVELDSNGETYVFTARPKEIRGQKFQLVFMNEEQLAFTTDLGKNWEVWMAYRELHANCLDENGKISNTPWEADTCWRIKGEEFEEAFHDRNKIFLHGEPAWVQSGVEIHRGRSNYLFYRGVRIKQLNKSSVFTYNITDKMKLTEDRTLDSMFDVMYKLGGKLPMVPSNEFQAMLVNPNKSDWENGVEVEYCSDPSEEFLDEGEKVIDHAQLNSSVKNLVLKKRSISTREPANTTEVEEKTLTEAIEMMEVLNARIPREDITVVEHLGPNIMGLMEHGRIFIPRQCIANGRDYTMITLWEEYIHRDLGHRDESRGMQQYLFDKILAFAKEKYDA